MDGNGRWAGKRALKRFLGHQKGAESVQFVVETASRINLPWLTLYAFSLENNLRRPKSEVSFLMKLLKSYLVGNVKRMNDNNVRMAYIGRTHDLPQEVQDTMQWAMESTARTQAPPSPSHSTTARAPKLWTPSAVSSQISPPRPTPVAAPSTTSSALARLEALDESTIARALYTRHMPDPDLVIRTSGEQRISNFLLWQIAYSEIYVTDRLWPDFNGLHLLEAIAPISDANADSVASARPSPTKTSTISSPPNRSQLKSRIISFRNPKSNPRRSRNPSLTPSSLAAKPSHK